jgi:hypothetical protein
MVQQSIRKKLVTLGDDDELGQANNEIGIPDEINTEVEEESNKEQKKV